MVTFWAETGLGDSALADNVTAKLVQMPHTIFSMKRVWLIAITYFQRGQPINSMDLEIQCLLVWSQHKVPYYEVDLPT